MRPFNEKHDVGFVWSKRKAAATLRNRGLYFEDACKVFLPEADFITRPSPRNGEARRVAIGAVGDRVYTVAYEQEGSVYRIVSFRRARDNEKKQWLEKA